MNIEPLGASAAPGHLRVSGSLWALETPGASGDSGTCLPATRANKLFRELRFDVITAIPRIGLVVLHGLDVHAPSQGGSNF